MRVVPVCEGLAYVHMQVCVSVLPCQDNSMGEGSCGFGCEFVSVCHTL